MANYQLSIDIGGTFTDLALHDRDAGTLLVTKSLSTPANPAHGALTGIDKILGQAGIHLPDVAEIVHATTHGANLLIERKGANTALLITEGFGDILLIQRQLRYSPYDLRIERHVPLVPRRHVYEVPERLMYDGSVHRQLDEDAVRRTAAVLREERIDTVGVSLLHSYVNPMHERRVAEILTSECPDILVSLSSDIAPVMREYERTSTVVANAYIRPAFQEYLSTFEHELGRRGFKGRISVMQANGGVANPAATIIAPARALESGPAGGVTLAATLANELNLGDVLAFDMGGTTAKAGLVRGGVPGIVDLFEVDKHLQRPGTGIPVLIPSVDIIEIGAGGGSIARAEFGTIAVGPESAGADPGPAAYGLGGVRPTVTDANLILGYLDPEFFNGGAMTLNVDAARNALETVGIELGLSVEEVAWGIHETVTSNMEHAIRAVSIDRGADPRELALVATGGAAPVHAIRLARALGMRRAVIPAYAGVGSSVGLMHCEPRFDLLNSFVDEVVDDAAARFLAGFEELDARALDQANAMDPTKDWALRHKVDVRFKGQGHSLQVEVPLDTKSSEFIVELRMEFQRMYGELYGEIEDEGTLEATALRVAVFASQTPPPFPKAGQDAADPRPSRKAYFPEAGGYVEVGVYRRADLAGGEQLIGPAVIEDAESTVTILPGDRVTVDVHRHLIVEINSQEAQT